MTISAHAGAIVSYGQANTGGGLGQALDYNPHLGPSMMYAGQALLDPRLPFTYTPGQKTGQAFYGFMATSVIPLLDYAPSTISTTAIAAAQVPTAGTALTLVSATGAGITAGASVVNAATGVLVTGLLAIDGAGGGFAFGSDKSINIWDPTKCGARNIQIASVGNDSTATATVVGFDIYGYPMSETITLSNATTAVGKKAFKYVQSITPAGTLSGSNVSVGQGDVYGFPLRDDQFAYIDIYWNNAYITATTGWTAADTTSPATKTTGDVRGTYAVQSASNGTKKLQVFLSPQVSNIGSVAGLFGVTQV